MPFLDAYAGTRRVDIGPPDLGYYVLLKEHISYREREEAERALSRMFISNGTQELRPDVTRYRQLMVLAHIQEWNLDDERGVWPVNLDSVKRLPGDEFDRLWVIVDDIASPPKDAVEAAGERRQFPGGGDERD
jgi:hypothetical protein